jgi:hypothetical protein
MVRAVFVRLAVILASLALIAAVAGCGGGGSSSSATTSTTSGQTEESGGVSKATFIKEGDAICTEYQAEVAPIKAELEELEGVKEPESPANLKKLGGLLNEALAGAETELESLRGLEPPAADEATIEKMVDTAEEGNGLAGEGASALEEGDVQRFGALVGEGEAINARATKLAESYGFKVCGQASP